MFPRSWSQRVLLLSCTLGLALLSTAPAQQPGGADGTKTIKAGSESADQTVRPYEKKWALIIGANYEGTSLKLENAENDARRLHGALTEDFGFKDKDTTWLLVGNEGDPKTRANRKNIWDILKNEVETKPGPNDCVVFFFSGHGIRRPVQGQPNSIGSIIPEGAELDGEGIPKNSDVVELEQIRSALENCPAKHRVIILDCCYSGQIFNLPIRPPRVGPDAEKKMLRDNRCFWAATACRASERARDHSLHSPNNSPFTGELLHQLDLLSGFDGNQLFTASKLFNTVQKGFEIERLDAQRPLAGPLTDESGDFLFFPQIDPQKRRPQGVDELLATLPGAQGDWWFDRTPWLMPSLRGDIITAMKGKGNTLTQADEARLNAEATAFLESKKKLTHVAGLGLTAARDKLRLEHLEKLLALKRTKDRAGVLREIRKDLHSRWDTLLAADQHLLALLEHYLEATQPPRSAEEAGGSKPNTAENPDRPPDRECDAKEKAPETVEDCYKQALKKYDEEDPDRRLSPMPALCLSDWGYYCLNQARYEDAAQKFQEARARLAGLGKEPPVHFLVFTWCKEAEAFRLMGNWDAANKRLETARKDAVAAHKDDVLVAFAWEHQAWSYITQWRVEDAKGAFETAASIRERRTDDLDSQILFLHDRHGGAMCRRFQGKGDEAVKEYGQLVKDIQTTLDEFVEHGDQRADYLASRTRLYERLRNSQERLADCLMFKEDSDFAEAARWLSKARMASFQLPLDQAAFTNVGMLYKLAICYSQSADRRDRLVVAGACLRAADKALKEGVAANQISQNQANNIKLAGDIARWLVALAVLPAGEADAPERLPANVLEAHDELYKLLNDQLTDREKRRRLQRDELELMLFATRVALRQTLAHPELPAPPERSTTEKVLGMLPLSPAAPAKAPTERFTVERFSSALYKLCRLVQENSSKDTRAYLRPSFDLVFEARLHARRGDIKGLLDVTAAARTGREFDEVVLQPTLAFYFPLHGQGYALLDVPKGLSKAFPLPVDLESAVQEKDKHALHMPEALQKELSKLNGDVYVHWKDPVHHLDDQCAALFKINQGSCHHLTLLQGDDRSKPGKVASTTSPPKDAPPEQ
jgi:tetratricopeptide (TPR) repeat protein